MHQRSKLRIALVALFAGVVAGAVSMSAAAWEPTKPVEFIVPAGTGGGADQMARLIQGVVSKHNLMKQPMIVVNKSGGAGAEGFLDVKDAKGDPHKIIITLSNLFTTPLATGVPFNWQDLTPVAMLALDQFVLWVNADTPYKTAKQYLDAVKAGGPTSSRWAAPARSRKTRSSPSRSRRPSGVKFIYVPFKGGGDVAVQLVGKHIDSIGQQSDRGGRAVARRQAAPAVRVRRRSACLTRRRSPTTCRGTTSRPARSPGFRSST